MRKGEGIRHEWKYKEIDRNEGREKGWRKKEQESKINKRRRYTKTPRSLLPNLLV